MTKREIIDNFMDKFKKTEEERKELSRSSKKLDVKIKKVKEFNEDKQNEGSEDDLQSMNLKMRDSVARGSRKLNSGQKKEGLSKPKTLPLIALTGNEEYRVKKCKISKML